MNWRRIIATGTVAGMIAVTGCSTNLPETNQGNRNGQRVVDAANRRSDTYRTTRNSAYNRSATTRGDGIIGRAVRDVMPNRSVNRSSNFGRPHARIGNAFRYGNTHYGRTQGLNNRGYDMGITTNDSAIVNSRTNRASQPTRSTTPNTTKTITNNTAPKVNKATKTTTRSAASNTAQKTTRNTAPKATTTRNKATNSHAEKVHVIPHDIAMDALSKNTHPAPVAKEMRNAQSRHRSAVNRQNRQSTRDITRSRNTTAKPRVQNENGYGMNLYQNRAARRAQQFNRTNQKYTSNRVGKNYVTHKNTRNRVGVVPASQQTVAVMNNDDVAFFNRKTEPATPEVTPNTAPSTTPAAPMPRSSNVPPNAPGATPSTTPQLKPPATRTAAMK